MTRPDSQPPRSGSRISTVAFLLVLLIGFAAAVLNPAFLRAPEATFADGTWASEYQTAFSQEFSLLDPARALWNALDLAVFRQAPAGVLTGAPGWLFTDEEYVFPAEPAFAHAEWMAVISSVQQQLAGHGVSLLVAVVPAKAAAVPQYAPPLPAAAAGRYANSLDTLTAAGIATVDLRPALSSEGAWLRTDTHWTPAGAASAAAAIARELTELVPQLERNQPFEAESLEPQEFRGDLFRLLALGPFTDTVGPAADVISQLHVSQPTGGDLFGEPELQLVLVGTSYSAATHWNLADRLRLELSADVLDASVSGRGPLEPMREYLQGDAVRNSPPLAVIWEIPERYLSSTEFLGGD